MNTIYYCHDQQGNPDARRYELECAGYRVKLMNSGSELVRAIADEEPDLVLIDVLLEGKNGFEVCRVLDLHLESRFDVILFGGIYNKSAFRDEARMLGVNEFVGSSCEAADLVVLVGRVFTRNADHESEAA